MLCVALFLSYAKSHYTGCRSAFAWLGWESFNLMSLMCTSPANFLSDAIKLFGFVKTIKLGCLSPGACTIKLSTAVTFAVS